MKPFNHFKIVYCGLYSEICPENLIHFASHKTEAKLHFQVIARAHAVCVCVCVCVCVRERERERERERVCA